MHHPDLIYGYGLEHQADLRREADLHRALHPHHVSLRRRLARSLNALALRLEPELRSEPQHALRA